MDQLFVCETDLQLDIICFSNKKLSGLFELASFTLHAVKYLHLITFDKVVNLTLPPPISLLLVWKSVLCVISFPSLQVRATHYTIDTTDIIDIQTNQEHTV